MSSPWNFVANIGASIWLNNGFAVAPAVPADYSNVVAQHMKPGYGNNFSTQTNLWLHRIIFETASVPPFTSTQITKGICVQLFDSNPTFSQWFIGLDVSIMPWADGTGNTFIDHWMLLVRIANF